MTAATMSQAPVIPPRPSKSPDKDESTLSLPKIPPRPITKRFERSISPNPDRFAPSPLHEGIPAKSPKALRFSPSNDVREHSSDPIDRSASVTMPSVGEEGAEYSAVTTELAVEAEPEEQEQDDESSGSPEQTRTVAEDLKLHAPKPSLPAHSAKQRVQAVTRTDSDKAASYGIGRPSSRGSLKKKPSTSFSGNSDGQPESDEQGIPEIGQRVPMNPHLGDVQAPSPGPGTEGFKKHHTRKHSSRGGPPGSYGLHGHGVAPQDKLDKAYYEKHPEVIEREHYTPIHDHRQSDFAMSSNDLNRLVRDTASRGSGLGTSAEYQSTPTDEVGFQASEEYASRISSPQPAGQRALSFKSEVTGPDGEKTIHVDDPEHPEYRSYGDEAVEDDDDHTEAPILASDEVSKDTRRYSQQPAVHPAPERRGSAAEIDEPTSRPTSRATSRPTSRPSSRPTSVYNNSTTDFGSTPLDDVKEYEPLFPEDEKKEAERKRKSVDEGKTRHHFPSKDVWEDAPESVHYTVEVSTPDLSEQLRRKSSSSKDRPKTPAHLFAQQQEELAEREVSGHAPTYLPRAEEPEKPTWPGRQGLKSESRPNMGRRFPSKDVWEDVPESQLYEAEISSPPKEEAKPDVPSRPVKKLSTDSEKPAIPGRPKPKQPPVSDKPKPQIPARPAKSSSGDSKDGEFSKPKPPVPSRPVGGKIAALQAGFMSDLNKRLQLGPQAPKKEEPKPQEDLTEEKEKAPLADARKGRARGPQRRAPARSPAAAPAAAETTPSVPTLSFSSPQSFWSIDPDAGDIALYGEVEEAPAVEEKTEEPVEASEPVEEPAAVTESPEPVQEPAPDEPPAMEEETEQKTLVANTAGESILEATIEKKDDEVEPVDVEDTVKA